MTKKEKNFILACILGDGCINKRLINNTIQCRFLMKHSMKQFEYFKWKVERLEKIFSSKRVNSYSMEKNSGRSNITACRYEKNHAYLKSLYSFVYQNSKKTFSKKVLNKLDAEGIAIWYMDDGSLYNVKYLTSSGKYRCRVANLTLNTYLSFEENKIIVDYFKNKWNITFKIAKGKNFTRLLVRTKEARKFIEIVKPYIHESMLYKIDIKVGQIV